MRLHLAYNGPQEDADNFLLIIRNPSAYGASAQTSLFQDNMLHSYAANHVVLWCQVPQPCSVCHATGAAEDVWLKREAYYEVGSKDLHIAVQGPCQERGIRCMDIEGTGYILLFERV